MKKLFCLSFILIMILTSCSYRNTSESTTQNESADESSTVAEISEHIPTNTIEETHFPDLSSEEKETKPVTENQKTDIHREEQESVQSSSPIILYLTLEDLREIKTAFNTMEPDDFMKYMETEKTEQYMTGFEDYESTEKLLNEICMTTVPLLEGDSEKFDEIAFFHKDSSINQLVEFEDDKRTSVIIYTASSPVESKLTLGEETVITSEKTITVDNLTVNLYETDNNFYDYFADVISDTSYIVFRGIQFETMEDFESSISRIKFVKIGDLLDDPEFSTEG